MNGDGDERAEGIISACAGAGDWHGMGAHACGCSVRAQPCWARSLVCEGWPRSSNMSFVAMSYDEYFVQHVDGGGGAHVQHCRHHVMAI